MPLSGTSFHFQSITEQLAFFHYTTRLPICVFNHRGEIHSARPDIDPWYVFDRAYLQKLLTGDTSLEDPSCVKLVSDSNDYHFIVSKHFSLEEEWIVAGPFLLESPPPFSFEKSAPSKLRKDELIPTTTPVPPSCTLRQINYLKDMLRLIKTHAYPLSNESSTEFEEDILPEDQIFQQSEEYTPFPYQLEQQFLHLLRNGDDQVLELMPSFDRYDSLTLASTHSRSIKNNLIVFVNTIIRTAIEAGLDPLQTIKLGESLIKKVEAQQNIEIPEIRRSLEQQLLKTVLSRIKRHVTADYNRMTQLIVEYIEKHLHENISLKDIADYCSRHPNYISTLFKKDTGYSIQEFLLNKRISKAKHFLRHSTHSILDISYYCGFQSQSYFTHQFKKVTKQTPNEFRKGG